MNKKEIKKLAREIANMVNPERWGKEFKEVHGNITCPICDHRTCGYQMDGKCTECGCKIDHYMPDEQ